MSEIQKQVEQFLNNTGDEAYRKAVYTLLRSVVEECCDCTTMAYEEDAIRNHFAWLLEEAE